MKSWKLVDRRTSVGMGAAIMDRTSQEDWPMAIFVPSPPFALGRVAALVSSEDAEEIGKKIEALPELIDLLAKYHALVPTLESTKLLAKMGVKL